MSKKSKKTAILDTYALCITTGLIVGFSLGTLLNSILLSTATGLILGIVAAYHSTRPKKIRK